jgi:uncharacterized SAM-binding protein YcdF (DUF218 family)
MSTTSGAGKAAVTMTVIRPIATQREQFCAMLSNTQLRTCDAAIVLCGEDALPRLEAARDMKEAVETIVLTGSRDEPPGIIGAETCHKHLLGLGVAPSKIVLDGEPVMHTREQAQSVLAMARREGWTHLLLIASPYHQYRAFLTFLRVLIDAEMDEDVRMFSAPATQTRWSESPLGMEETRLQRLHSEFSKIEQYSGDVATYAEGIGYLKFWEERGG